MDMIFLKNTRHSLSTIFFRRGMNFSLPLFMSVFSASGAFSAVTAANS
jgi:hypothetical protein